MVGLRNLILTFKSINGLLMSKNMDDNIGILIKDLKTLISIKLTLSHNDHVIDFRGVMKDSTPKILR